MQHHTCTTAERNECLKSLMIRNDLINVQCLIILRVSHMINRTYPIQGNTTEEAIVREPVPHPPTEKSPA